jgi:sulfur carrier protein
VQVIINGSSREIAPHSTVKEALESLGFVTEFIAVAVNLELVPRSSYDERRLEENDEVEILSPHQGG